MPTQTHARREAPSQTLADRRQTPADRHQTRTQSHTSPAARHAAQLQSRLDASPRVQAVQRVVQRNGDGNENQSWFSKYIFGKHFYKVRHQANSPLSGESDEDTTRRTYESLKKKPAPGNRGKGASRWGTPIWLFPFGKILSQSNDEESSVTNTTQFPHLFHRGWVKRKAIGSDVETEGGGYGLLPGVNNYFANWLWGNQALRLRLKNDPKFKQEWDQDSLEKASL